MSTIYMKGVLEDGTPHDEALVPYDPRTPLRYTRGESMTLVCTLLGRDGVPVDLSSAQTSVRLTVKQSSEDDENIVSVLGTKAQDTSTGVVTFIVPVSAFSDWPPGTYVYDIWLLRTEGNDPVVPLSAFIVQPTVRSFY